MFYAPLWSQLYHLIPAIILGWWRSYYPHFADVTTLQCHWKGQANLDLKLGVHGQQQQKKLGTQAAETRIISVGKRD